MANNMYALVLFDVDGCTAVVESKKLKMEGKDLVTGQMGHMTFAREKLQVEILQLSGMYRKQTLLYRNLLIVHVKKVEETGTET